MANIKISIHNRSVKARLKALSEWKINEEDKRDVKRFLSDLELGKVNNGKKIGVNRQLRYLDNLKILLEFFSKPVKELTQKDVEGFEKAISSDKLKSKFKNKPYAPETKVSIKTVLRIYLKWKLGENAHKLVGWMDTRIPRKTPDYLSEEEIEKLYRAANSAEVRYLIAVLFDTGARAEEFHNIRFEDIELPSEKNNFVRIILKEEYSKTNGRTIGLYWKYSAEAVKDYIEERKKEGVKSTDPVFKNRYDNVRFILGRLGRKVLNKRVHYHLFRHSSATYYATKLNRQELCYRYGWKFSSEMPDVYISRSGMMEKQIDEKFSNSELGELKKRLEKQESSNKILRSGQEKLKAEMEEIRKANAELMQTLKGGAK